MARKIAFSTMSRRTFLQIAAHLSLVSATQVISHPLVARAIQTTPSTGGYGSGAYGQGVYAGSSGFGEAAAAKRFPLEHTLYLPIINKEEN